LFAQSIFLFLLLLARPQSDRVSFRIITVPTETKAVELRARIVAGESFEALARENSTDASAPMGGFAGPLNVADLRRELRVAVTGLQPGQLSPVLKMGNEFFILQYVAPEEVDWTQENAQASEFLRKERYADAAKSFSKAVALAEKFGADDDRLAQSINGLAEAYRLQEDYAAAESVYRRILSIRWSASPGKEDPAVANLVDRCADVLLLAYFRGREFEQALKQYADALNKTPASEALYLAMTSMLVKAELTAEAADVMQRALRAFPSSRRLRYKEAEMHRDSGRMRKALETFQQASQMKAPPGLTPERDRLQLSFIYQRIGGINIDLADFDAATQAYKKALEIMPDNADARLALGDAYFRRGRHSEALAEYTNVLASHSDNALPHYRVADANLQMGNFSEAAAAAVRALKIDPQLRKARYVRGMALVRMEMTDEGEKELQEFRKQEADAQQDLNNLRSLVVANRGASALVLEGKGEEAIGAFRKAIDEHPQAAILRLHSAVALQTLGRPRDAAITLQNLIDSGLDDDFLAYRSLSRAYEMLKDEKASRKYAALYVRQIDVALEKELQ
jgi:tetratricopeptide (TPR) repeat protein